jgi:cell division protein FtsX
MLYALQQAFVALRTNWVASVATVTTMTLSLTILAVFSLTSLNMNLFLADLQDELEVTAFLHDDANHPQLLETIRSWPEVDARRVLFIPKDTALQTLVADLPALGQSAALVSNPLPNTITLRLLDPSQTSQAAGRLRQLPGVADLLDGSQDAELFLAINDALRVVGSILIIVMLTSALFAIVNSIRAAITARHKEIEVMRLVGATQGFIRAPFLFEGLLLGLGSAAITIALVVPGYRFIVQRLAEQLPFVPLMQDDATMLQVSGLLLVLALLVGLVGSAIGVSQHLREGN